MNRVQLSMHLMRKQHTGAPAGKGQSNHPLASNHADEQAQRRAALLAATKSRRQAKDAPAPATDTTPDTPKA